MTNVLGWKNNGKIIFWFSCIFLFYFFNKISESQEILRIWLKNINQYLTRTSRFEFESKSIRDSTPFPCGGRGTPNTNIFRLARKILISLNNVIVEKRLRIVSMFKNSVHNVKHQNIILCYAETLPFSGEHFNMCKFSNCRLVTCRFFDAWKCIGCYS